MPNNPNLDERTNLILARLPHEVFGLTDREVSIGQGYNKGLELAHGMIFWHDRDTTQGISVQLTGLDLQVMRQSGIKEIDLLKFIDRRGGKVTTLHACINVKNAGASPSDVIKAQSDGVLTTRARNIGQYSSETKGHDQWHQGTTVYIGSPKSGVQIRIYNKAAEQHVSGDWLRIEIVWRGKYARAAHVAMLASGIAAVTRGAIQKQVSLPNAWWGYAMRGDTSLPEPVRRKETGTYTWLKNVVLPALEREIRHPRDENSDEIYALFAALIDKHR